MPHANNLIITLSAVIHLGGEIYDCGMTFVLHIYSYVCVSGLSTPTRPRGETLVMRQMCLGKQQADKPSQELRTSMARSGISISPVESFHLLLHV